MDSNTMNRVIEELNGRFAIERVAQVVAGRGGLATVRVSSEAASAEIYLHGAHVTSWQPAGEEEVIFLSEQSRWEPGRAIRGGIPICFPWFRAKADDANAPQHGFARTAEWELESVSLDGKSVVIALALEADEASRKLWPHVFRAVHRITVGAELKLELAVTNLGSEPFQFEEALHTYHRVGDVEQVRVAGLDGVAYLDNRDGNREKRQQGDVVLTGAMDNAYFATAETLEIIDTLLRRQVRIEKQNSLTTVVWNPWAEAAKSMADLGDEEWRQFACVEASNILNAAVTLGPGEQHTVAATIRVAKL
jgi:glucose-6-phosphate 1-epimerase